MKKSFYLFVLVLLASSRLYSQQENKVYITYGPEAIMSFGLIDDDNNTTGTIIALYTCI